MTEKIEAWGHDALMRDLAAHLRATRDRVIWEDMQLGPSGSPRPDVYSMPKSFCKFLPLAYEIKVSASDFRRDITAGKWQSYLQYAAGVTFAVPAGLIGRDDVPKGCGLMVRGPDGWRTLKAPTMQRLETLPHKVWMKLMIDGIERQPAKAREPRSSSMWSVARAANKRLGDRIAGLLHDLAMAEHSIQYAIQKADEQREMIERRAAEHADRARQSREADRVFLDNDYKRLAISLGLPMDCSHDDLRAELNRARLALNRDEEIMRLRNALAKLRRAAMAEIDPLMNMEAGEPA